MLKTKFIFKFLMGLLLMALAAPLAQAETVTVCARTSSTSTDSHYPFYGLYLDVVGTESQMIYPSDLFENIDGFVGCTINSITFTSTSNIKTTLGGTYIVRFGETSETTISDYSSMTSNRDASTMSIIYTGSFNDWNGGPTITFSPDHTYNGGNIIIDTYVQASSSYESHSFYGVTATSGTSAYYQKSFSSGSFLPEMIIDYTPATSDPYKASVTPTNYDFGVVLKNGSVSTTVTLKNRGTESFSPILSGLSAPFSATMESGALASGETRDITITYNPTAISTADNGMLTINCGEAGNLTVTLTGSCNNDLTICEGSTTNGIAPIYGSYYDETGTIVRMLYPADMLTSLVGKKISKVKFYSTANAYISGGKFQVSVAETNQTTALAENELTTDGWTVVNDNMSLTANATELEIEFDGAGYEYLGGNLLIETKVLTGGTSSRSNFYGVSQSNNTLYSNKTYGTNNRMFLPKATFSINETGDVYGATVEPNSLAFGSVNKNESLSKVFTLTNTGTGEAAFTPEFSITGANADMFKVDTDVADYDVSELDVEDSRDYYVIFSPTAEGDFTATLNISMTGADGNVRTTNVALSGSGNKALYEASATPKEGLLDFGKILVGRDGTKKVTITNLGSQSIVPQASITGEGFTVSYTPATVSTSGTAEMNIVFTPTTVGAIYNGRLTVTAFDGETFTWTLKGEGADPATATLYDNETYTWPINSENPVTSSFSEIATDPDQMIALLRAVYMNQNLPGSYYRGYTSEGAHDKDVVYPAIGKLDRYGEYEDSYGWNIPTTKAILSNTVGSQTYQYFEPTEYKPSQEGLTLLLVEMNDYVDNNSASQTPSSYSSLRSIFKTMFKSVRVITSSKQSGTGEDAGTLFKIDCDRMNRFFFLGKGRLRQYDYSNNYGDQPGSFLKGTSFTEADNGPFFEMFEQFSPVSLVNAAYATDIYQTLVQGMSYPVEHDCDAIPWASAGNNVVGHEFNLYGRDSESDDCQDVRDLMLFIPEYRMKWWYESMSNSRDGNEEEVPTADMFKNYNQAHLPTMGLFVINQHVIEGEKVENALKYTLHLSWESNLLQFLPASQGKYTLLQVTTNEDGVKTYTPVGVIDANTTEYDLVVDMAKEGQELTFVVRGQDNEEFLSLQYSNERSFYVPGYENKEQLRLALNNDSYFSRFDPQLVQNNYSNSITISNNTGTAVKASYLVDGSEFKLWRAPNGDTDNAVNFANATVVSKSAGTMSISTVASTQSEFAYGYHSNTGKPAPTFTIDGENVVFNNFNIYDNFSEPIPTDNSHPNNYVYYVTLETAVPFTIYDAQGNESTSSSAISNTATIPVYKTAMAMNPLTQTQVDNDATHAVPANIVFDVNVNYSSKSEILRYDAYRWADSEYGTSSNPRVIIESATSDQDEEDVNPQGQANNQGESYTIKMNSDYTSSVNVTAGAIAQARFEDNFMLQNPAAETYTYAPVVELFAPLGSTVANSETPRADYNTYGAPLQIAAGGKIEVEVEKEKADYTWTANGNTYTYYNVKLKVESLGLPSGYELYKVRAWRKIDSSYLGEEKGKGYEGRLTLDANGEYKFVESDDCQQGGSLGSNVIGNMNGPIYEGTFGAKALEGNEYIPMKFVVRIYFTKSTRAEGDQPYYIAEVEVDDELSNDITTSISGVVGMKIIKSIKYYNMAGIESDVPFQGVNIEVTTYDDGSRSTRKIMK